MENLVDTHYICGILEYVHIFCEIEEEDGIIKIVSREAH